MCEETKQGIILYHCDRKDTHTKGHHFSWPVDEEGKIITYETWW